MSTTKIICPNYWTLTDSNSYQCSCNTSDCKDNNKGTCANPSHFKGYNYEGKVDWANSCGVTWDDAIKSNRLKCKDCNRVLSCQEGCHNPGMFNNECANNNIGQYPKSCLDMGKGKAAKYPNQMDPGDWMGPYNNGYKTELISPNGKASLRIINGVLTLLSNEVPIWNSNKLYESAGNYTYLQVNPTNIVIKYSTDGEPKSDDNRLAYLWEGNVGKLILQDNCNLEIHDTSSNIKWQTNTANHCIGDNIPATYPNPPFGWASKDTLSGNDGKFNLLGYHKENQNFDECLELARRSNSMFMSELNGECYYGSSTTEDAVDSEMTNKYNSKYFSKVMGESDEGTNIFNFLGPKSSTNIYPVYEVPDKNGDNIKERMERNLQKEINFLKDQEQKQRRAIDASTTFLAAVSGGKTYEDAYASIQQQKIADARAKKEAELAKIQKQLSLYNTVLSSDNQALRALNNISTTNTTNIKNNFSTLNSIDENLLTKSQNIMDSREIYNYNSKIVKYLGIGLAILFALMLIMFCYYGIKGGMRNSPNKIMKNLNKNLNSNFNNDF